MSDLRERIAAIVERVWLGDDEYWQGDGEYSAALDREAVVNDIMEAIAENDDDVLEAFGGG